MKARKAVMQARSHDHSRSFDDPLELESVKPICQVTVAVIVSPVRVKAVGLLLPISKSQKTIGMDGNTVQATVTKVPSTTALITRLEKVEIQSMKMAIGTMMRLNISKNAEAVIRPTTWVSLMLIDNPVQARHRPNPTRMKALLAMRARRLKRP
jgi:hypothetical protein